MKQKTIRDRTVGLDRPFLETSREGDARSAFPKHAT